MVDVLSVIVVSVMTVSFIACMGGLCCYMKVCKHHRRSQQIVEPRISSRWTRAEHDFHVSRRRSLETIARMALDAAKSNTDSEESVVVIVAPLEKEKEDDNLVL